MVDFIGLDTYDTKYNDCAATEAQRWDATMDQMNNLKAHRDFTRSRRKPTSFPEWGVCPTGMPYCGGGDFPAYIDRMADWFASDSALVYQSYFNTVGTADHRFLSFHKIAGRFKVRFGPTAVGLAPTPAANAGRVYPGNRFFETPAILSRGRAYLPDGKAFPAR